MPMAGEGSRFLAQGYTMPKPLIQIEGKSLFLRALSSLDNIEAYKRYSFIVRKKHIDKFSIDSEILQHFPDAVIFSVEKTTRGAVETCLLAKNNINNEDGVLVLDCDLEFYSSEFNNAIMKILKQPASVVNGGLLLSFIADNPRYSYAQADDSGRVICTAEKKVLSNNALAGAYFFSTVKSFFFSANRLISEATRIDSELYISLLYNYLIEAGETVRLVKTQIYRSFGTPEELKQYVRQDIADPYGS